MRLFISIDMEGVTGVVNFSEIDKDPQVQRAARKMITREINAAIEGVRDAGAALEEVLVCDSHALGKNVLLDELDPIANIVRGFPRPIYMMEGLDQRFDTVYFLGYHSRVGVRGGVMDHSFSLSTVHNFKLNGEIIGETEFNAGLAAHYDVPLGLVAGDDILAEQVKVSFGGDVKSVITKQGISKYAAICRPAAVVLDEIRKASQEVALSDSKGSLKKIAEPITCEIEFAQTVFADMAELIPTIRRVDGRTIRFHSPDFVELYRTTMAVLEISAAAKNVA